MDKIGKIMVPRNAWKTDCQESENTQENMTTYQEISQTTILDAPEQLRSFWSHLILVNLTEFC